jgi:hypothetical protein
MNRRLVQVHKMFEEFRLLPKVMYIGEYDNDCNLINVYNQLQEKLTRIFGTYQWILPSTNEVFFIDENTNFQINFDQGEEVI